MNKNNSIPQFLKRFNDKSALLLLIMLLSADLVFIIINFIIDLSPSLRHGNFQLFSIYEDRSYPELFQYLKWFWIIIAIIIISRSRHSIAYLAWGLVALYFLADDSVGIHELIGKNIVENLNIKPLFSLRPQDIGELIVYGISAFILLSVVVLSYILGNVNFRRFSQDMILLMVFLFFFGVIFDMLSYLIPVGHKLTILMYFIEDGSEMFIASLMLWYVFQASRQEDTKFIFLNDYFRHRKV
jgi:hypothetical protein